MARFAYSYADPVAGAVVLVLRGQKEDLATLLPATRELSAEAKIHFAASLDDFAWTYSRSTVIHEWAHLLQAASYPQLYLRAVRNARVVAERWNYLRARPGVYALPLQLRPRERWLLSSMLSTALVKISVGDQSVEMTWVEEGELGRGFLSEHDLIEEDASILQYKVEIGAPGNGAGYRRWLAEGKHYERAFSLLSRHLGSDDFAYQMLPSMVRAAFRVTRPLDAFATLLATIIPEGPDVFCSPGEQVVTSWLHDLFVSVLTGKFAPADENSVNFEVPALDDAPGLISQDQMNRFVAATSSLPLHLLAKWNIEKGNYLDEVFLTPWQHFGRRAREITPDLQRFRPPLTSFLVDHPDFYGGHGLNVVSPAAAAAEPPGNEAGYTNISYIRNYFQFKLLADAYDGTRRPLRTCPHEACVFHDSGLCDGWISIPSKFEECGFPDFFKNLTKYQISADGRSVSPIN